ncbi:hypothetical protein NDU88_003363 [Pleurodeles waltl]|uniref:Uncharacterized protein n=1 Tax=Pleurodeles waltl TaxID=8319 RepID=A0AAV7MQC5_PLEWA|nr:hypothetical protein NDU88_003363 [Pleurodeles waltl]
MGLRRATKNCCPSRRPKELETAGTKISVQKKQKEITYICEAHHNSKEQAEDDKCSALEMVWLLKRRSNNFFLDIP